MGPMCSNDEKYLEFVIMFRECTHGLIFILYAKKLNASRPEQPYTEAPVKSQVTQKKLTFHGTSSLETMFTTAQHHRRLSRARKNKSYTTFI